MHALLVQEGFLEALEDELKLNKNHG